LRANYRTNKYKENKNLHSFLKIIFGQNLENLMDVEKIIFSPKELPFNWKVAGTLKVVDSALVTDEGNITTNQSPMVDLPTRGYISSEIHICRS